MPHDAEALFKQAKELETHGRDDQAQAKYFEVLDAEPQHFGALNNLGNLFAQRGLTAPAVAAYREALKWHPNNVAGHINLGAVLLDADDTLTARNAFERALQLDPDSAEAHQGLSAVFGRLGDELAAQRHRLAGFRNRAVVRAPFRGEGSPLARILLLLSAKGGNVDLRRILDDRRFEVTKVFVDACDATIPLPEHDLVFNAIGDADLCADALEAAAAIVAGTGARVLNPPTAVRATGRVRIAQRLSGIPGIVVPRIERFARDAVPQNLRYPLVVRALGYHTGAHLARVSNRAELLEAVQRLPGEDLLALEFLDARGADGNVRKYRVMLIGGEIYPLHLAISSEWMVHYFTADNRSRAEYRDEEARFLGDMAATLGPIAMTALKEVSDVLGLDYAGVDFGLDADGNVLLFEANATMTVPAEPTEAIWAYRRAPIHRVTDAVESLIALASSQER